MEITQLSGANLSPMRYGGHPVFVVDNIQYYMASKHLSVESAMSGDASMVARYLNWYLRLFKLPITGRGEARKRMDRIQQARAMKCFGGLLESVERDPDPHTQDKLQAEYNCANCETRDYCKRLADTLVD